MTIIEYIPFITPNLNIPKSIIIKLTIKLYIDTLILKNLLFIRFIVLTPPLLKPSLYIREPVIPHIVPATIENIKVLEKYTNLSEKEKIEIKSLKRGECLMFIGAEHILTKIESADFEKEIIESNKERNLL